MSLLPGQLELLHYTIRENDPIRALIELVASEENRGAGLLCHLRPNSRVKRFSLLIGGNVLREDAKE